MFTLSFLCEDSNPCKIMLQHITFSVLFAPLVLEMWSSLVVQSEQHFWHTGYGYLRFYPGLKNLI